MIQFGEKLANKNYVDRLGSYAIIVKNDLLAVIEEGKHYFLIGGGVENDENLEEALKRETLEEIGYKVQINQKIAEAKQYTYSDIEKRGFNKICYFFEAEIIGEKTIQSTENELIWVTYDQFLQKNKHESYLWAINKIL